jgi:carbon dioxide concentrating mechanism protein CcmO
MAALMAATDAMLKAAQVWVCGRHGIGSGWLTVVIEGDVAAVQTAIGVGKKEAVRYGDLIYSEVIARPDSGAIQAMPHGAAVPHDPKMGPRALGVLETVGMTALVAGADAMAKAADVELAGWAFIGGGLVHMAVRGDVAAVQTAVEVGRVVAEREGKVNATLVLPQPVDGVGALMPPAPSVECSATGALGVVETTGYLGGAGGSDAMLKAANVELLSLTIASGGRLAALVRGQLDDVQAAVLAGRDAAANAGELEASVVVSRPDAAVMACFGAVAPNRRQKDSAGKAMGLIETRSTIALVKAVDQMLKTAEVECEGNFKVGYFLTASVIRGDVGAVRAALDVGLVEAQKHGDFVTVHLIPRPYEALEERLAHHF